MRSQEAMLGLLLGRLALRGTDQHVNNNTGLDDSVGKRACHQPESLS